MKIKITVFQIVVLLLLISCGQQKKQSQNLKPNGDSNEKITIQKPARLTLKQANNLVELPLACLQTEYPNKLGQTLGEKEDLIRLKLQENI